MVVLVDSCFEQGEFCFKFCNVGKVCFASAFEMHLIIIENTSTTNRNQKEHLTY